MTCYLGDCRDVMHDMDADSVDAIVTDPPYGLEFMGKDWDKLGDKSHRHAATDRSGFGLPRFGSYAPFASDKAVAKLREHRSAMQDWHYAWVVEALRVAKPGAHLLAFGGTRTFHRLACAIEDAGWEIRDTVMFLYGSGFPKSLDVGKAIDKAAGAERDVIGTRDVGPDMRGNNYGRDNGARAIADISTPTTEAARQWDGWGTALKPAYEPIILARKPLVGTVAANVQQFGTGALNIDACRVSMELMTEPDVGSAYYAKRGRSYPTSNSDGSGGSDTIFRTPAHDRSLNTTGRWPANVIHDGSDEVLAAFPHVHGAGYSTDGVHCAGTRAGERNEPGGFQYGGFAHRFGDTGSAARFFMSCSTTEGEQWADLPSESVSIANESLSRQRSAVVFALVHAVNLALPEGLCCASLCLEPSTSATPRELDWIVGSVTQTIHSFASAFWHESQPVRLSLSFSHASVVVSRERTGTMTITASRWKLDGSADPVTFNITRQSVGRGEADLASRVFYTAKASQDDRNFGCASLATRACDDWPQGLKANATRGATPRANHHPTVKPTDLMRYLCRLITPPGGLVLDPFMGSGSTGKAAKLEGFRFVGIEQDETYLEIARNRIHYTQAQERMFA